MDRCLNCMQQTASDVCPYCGYNISSYELQPGVLKPQTCLKGRYYLGRILGRGGFGITYNGWDAQTGRRVAIKEYFPSGLAVRLKDDNTISAVSSVNTQAFKSGVVKFFDEAQILSEFRSVKEIVEIYDFFYENETSYIVMEYIEGENILQIMTRRNRMETETAVDIILKLTSAMIKVHAKDVLHRDISPSNIIVTEDGGIKLIDFGSARQFAVDQSNSMSVILKNGFAPIEQYSRKGNHGPWTDIYSICATFYYMITGNVPEQATDRVIEDALIPPSEFRSDITPQQEAVLLKGLAVKAADRYRSASELKDAIKEAYGNHPVTAPPVLKKEQKTVSLDDVPEPVPKEKKIRFIPVQKEKKARYVPVIITTICAAIIILTMLSLTIWRKPGENIQTNTDTIKIDEKGTQITESETDVKQTETEPAVITKSETIITEPAETEQAVISVTEITLNKKVLSLEKGGTDTLAVTINPTDASDNKVTWSTSSTNVASVSDGKVTAGAEGTAVITAKTSNGKTASCTVTVKPGVVNPESVSLNAKTYELAKGFTLTLTATVYPSNATDKTVTWTSSNTGVATVTDSKITALSAGIAVITVKTSNGKTASCTVTVTAVEVEKVNIEQTSVILNYGEAVTLAITVSPVDAADELITLTSSDPRVVSINGYTLTAKKAGTVMVKATSSNGKTDTCTVTVNDIQATGITLDKTSLSLVEGETATLTAAIIPSNATDTFITWIIENGAVAAFNKQVNEKTMSLDAVSKGITTVTAKTSNGKTAICTVTVKPAITAGGTFGVNGTWTIYDDGELILSGKGSMENYNIDNSLYAPWHKYRDNIKTVIINDGFSSIGNGAFAGCGNIPDITIPNNITEIGEKAFNGCGSLTKITIPDSVINIGQRAFADCGSLKNITIPNSVKVLGDGVFAGCGSLFKITIPNSVTDIGIGVFNGCSGLTSINVDADNMYYASDEFGILYDKSKTKLIKSPVASILNVYTIPANITYIAGQAFAYSYKITEIYIWKSLAYIGAGAFEGWTNKQMIRFEGRSSAPLDWDIGWNNGCNAVIKWNQ